MKKKKDLQKRLDQLRRNDKSYKKGTSEFKERLWLEQQLDQHLYDKDEL